MSRPHPSCLVVLMCSLLLSASCRPHVQLKAPESTAPAETRVAAFNQLRATQMQTTEVTSNAAIGSQYQLIDFLDLNDGTRVYHPADVMSVLAPESDAYKNLAAAESDASLAYKFYYGAIAGVLVGTILTGTQIVDGSKGPLLYGGLGLVAGGVIAIPIGNSFSQRATHRATDGFRGYNVGLMRKLNVCEDGRQVTSCP